MEEDVKFIIRDLKADNYNKTLVEQLEHLLQAYKENEAVIDFLAEEEYKRDELYYRQALRCF